MVDLTKARLAVIASCIVLIAVAFGLYYFFPTLDKDSASVDALVLSKVAIIGLAVVVALMAGLAIVFWAIGIEDRSQALGLPEGSVRALIAFSLVLAFICMASFLYSGTGGAGETAKGVQITLINQAELDSLKSQFVVAYETARRSAQDPILDTDNKSPLFNATYYVKHSQAADDLAKQIFTTLATVFVSVVSFYFGSSTTRSAVAAGAKAVISGAAGPVVSGQAPLADGQADAASTPSAPSDRPGPSTSPKGDLAVAPLTAPVPQQS